MSQASPDTTTARAFGAYVSFLGTPLPDDPLAAIRILRAEAEAVVERMIAFLDATAPDPDLEPDADGEPSLGATEDVCQPAAWSSRPLPGVDLESDGLDAGEGDDADLEGDGLESGELAAAPSRRTMRRLRWRRAAARSVPT